ncbi:MAG: HAMP domain-containing sensor histidine kinase [Kofleriaceae bacterium]|nr:HAMP domain-containing sensor histidine kinase [Kofleriaceae bacterium]
MKRGPQRTLVAAGLLAALLAALLVAWFYAGWADVRARQRIVRAAPVEEAAKRASTLAHELRMELTGLVGREGDRPYFHYQNLIHDPRASSGESVSPSPLATEPNDPLVLGYFQLDAKGRATTPRLNDDVPILNEQTELAENLRFRAEVTRSLATKLAPPELPTVVAVADPPKKPMKKPALVVKNTVEAVKSDTATAGQVALAPPKTKKAKVITIDRDSYAQNSRSNSIYQDNLPRLLSTEQQDVQSQDVQPIDPPPALVQQQVVAPSPPAVQERVQVPVRRRAPVPKPEPEPPNDPVTIVVSPLEWHTQVFDGAPSLIALRQVTTPDGNFSQGFVVDRATLTSWLAVRAGDDVIQLATGDDATAELVPGWHLTGTPNPQAIASAATEAARLARTFMLRFVVVGVIAALAAALVVLLVARAERLARERSQFAAAAAHELRTPLAGLQLYGDMLADGLGDPLKQRDYARRMSEEASRLGRVVSNVLGFSQLERGNLSVEPTVRRLDDELRQLAERAEPALDRAGAMLALEVEPELSARFDRDALARIVGNLLDNAEKYSRDAEDRTITLAARKVGDLVEVTVADHGPGIAAATRSRLFRPFSRGVPADGPAGLGLGLALSQSLARAMGGDLEHRPGGAGATFVLRLPVA